MYQSNHSKFFFDLQLAYLSEKNSIDNPALEAIRANLISYNESLIKRHSIDFSLLATPEDLKEIMLHKAKERLEFAEERKEFINHVNLYSSLFEDRERIIRKYYYPILNSFLLQSILDFSELKSANKYLIVEHGAGSGYLANLLMQVSLLNNKILQMDAYDKETYLVDGSVNPKFRFEKQYYPVIQDNVKVLKDKRYKDYTLLLSWPDLKKDFAYNAIKSFVGNKLVYLADPELCATEKFHEQLDKNWELIESKVTINYPGINENIFFYTRENRKT